MIFEIEKIKGLYIIPNVFNDEEHNFYMEKLKNDSCNKCPQIHMANEHGWKFIPVRENGLILKRTRDDYLGFPDWMDNLKLHTIRKLKQFLTRDFNINHVLINKYEIDDGCHDHIDELEFWTDFIIGVSFGSSTVMKFSNDKSIIDVNIPKNSIYVMTGDVRYNWTHGIDFQKSDNIYGKIRDRDIRISVTFREIKKEYLPCE